MNTLPEPPTPLMPPRCGSAVVLFDGQTKTNQFTRRRIGVQG